MSSQGRMMNRVLLSTPIRTKGKKKENKPELTLDIEKRLRKMQLAGTTAKAAIAAISEETGLSRKELYKTWLRLDKSWDTKEPCRSLERS